MLGTSRREVVSVNKLM